MGSGRWETGQILADVFERSADLCVETPEGGAQLACWREVAGVINLPALGRPSITASLAPRKPSTRIAGTPTFRLIAPAVAEDAGAPDTTSDFAIITLNGEPALSLDQIDRALADALGGALVRQIFDELIEEGSPGKEAYLEALLKAFRALTERGAHPMGDGRLPVSSSSAHRLHRVLESLRQRPGDPHSIEEMAASAGLTPDHFSKMFKAAMGVPPRQYLLRLRIDHAMRLLSETHLSLAEIAESLGFDSPSHLSRVFRAQAGKAPGAYRRGPTKTLH